MRPSRPRRSSSANPDSAEPVAGVWTVHGGRSRRAPRTGRATVRGPQLVVDHLHVGDHVQLGQRGQLRTHLGVVRHPSSAAFRVTPSTPAARSRASSALPRSTGSHGEATEPLRIGGQAVGQVPVVLAVAASSGRPAGRAARRARRACGATARRCPSRRRSGCSGRRRHTGTAAGRTRARERVDHWLGPPVRSVTPTMLRPLHRPGNALPPSGRRSARTITPARNVVIVPGTTPATSATITVHTIDLSFDIESFDIYGQARREERTMTATVHGATDPRVRAALGPRRDRGRHGRARTCSARTTSPWSGRSGSCWTRGQWTAPLPVRRPGHRAPGLGRGRGGARRRVRAPPGAPADR